MRSRSEHRMIVDNARQRPARALPVAAAPKPRQIARWWLFARWSVVGNLLLACAKLSFGLYSASLFLALNALYNLGMAGAKSLALYGYRLDGLPPDARHPQGYQAEARRSYARTGLVVALTSGVYVICCVLLFFWQHQFMDYSLPVALAIATVSFGEIGFSAYGLRLSWGGRNAAGAALKMTNLAAALISLVLTQTALLSLNHQDVLFFHGLSGVFFGSCAIGIGLCMLRLFAEPSPECQTAPQQELAST